MPLQPPDAVQLCAPLAVQLKVTGSPALTLVALNCSEIEGFATAGVAVLASPLPFGVKLSPSHAASEEISAQASSQCGFELIPNLPTTCRMFRHGRWAKAICHNAAAAVITSGSMVIRFGGAANLSPIAHRNRCDKIFARDEIRGVTRCYRDDEKE